MNLLKRFSTLSPIYQGELTNHLPMLIIALESLGVANSSIKTIAEEYVTDKSISDLHSQLTALPITPFEKKYISLTNTFLNVINDSGLEVTLTNFFKQNQFSLASGLFHGLIRLYYAILSENDLQIAQALSYFFIISSEEILTGHVENNTNTFKELIKKRTDMSIKFESQGSMDKFQTLLEIPFIKEGIFTLPVSESKEEEILSLFVSEYLSTRDFYTLHVITGFHALHSLKDYFEDYNSVLDNFFLQAQVFMLINNHKDLFVFEGELRLFESTLEIAQLEDAHNIKLLHTCVELYDIFKIDDIKKIITTIKENGLNY